MPIELSTSTTAAVPKTSNDPPNITFIQGRKTKCLLKYMDEPTRRALLEQDEWASDVKPNSLICNGCKKTFILDRRFRYYPAFWWKHRDRYCKEIRRLRGENALVGSILSIPHAKSSLYLGPSSGISEETPGSATSDEEVEKYKKIYVDFKSCIRCEIPGVGRSLPPGTHGPRPTQVIRYIRCMEIESKERL
jgi:hypothetical protein